MLYTLNYHSVVDQLYFKNKQTNKQTHRERNHICGFQRQDMEEGGIVCKYSKGTNFQSK